MNCPHANLCGGCSLLHLVYGDQLVSKESSIRELLQAAVPGQPALQRGPLFLPVPGDPAFPAAFRQKVAFVFGADPSGRLAIGHYRRGSQRVVPVDECLVHSARGNRIAFALRDHLARAGIGAAGSSPTGILRHVIIRATADDREAVAMLVVTRNDRSLRTPVRALLESPDRPDGFFININTNPGPLMIGRETIRIDGRSQVREEVGGVSFLISPTAFFQTNVRAAEVLQAYVAGSTSGAGQVLDLYCGSGLFSLAIAARGGRVTGVEENRQAIADARANALLNRIPSSRTRFMAIRVEDAVRSLSGEHWDAVILDPPRQGCSDAVLEAVFERMQPPRVTYVSCNPGALAAELPGIVQCGYRVDELRAIDMFPHTDHLEAIVRLSRPEPRRS